MKALIVQPDGSTEVREVKEELSALRECIGGGWLEGVNPSYGLLGFTADWHAYCDEEGKLKGLAVNKLATKLAWLNGWPVGDVLCGPVVFLGNGVDGTEADVPERIIELAKELR